ncbi:alpha/beta hydrolase [Dactylosporangium sp. AC04546]|uniref:alpha/beta hydrolase n=1 Tax=Dactylosporangium sp. AC04546 TaxID=2862460 RepID=UPI001EDD0191|nr:alpha/beta hydrolase [Dactylosporangium sp. AC04546]WVK87656.1 alpha/beta hydrolase [Dactylosporangium sp. AC04546]
MYADDYLASIVGAPGPPTTLDDVAALRSGSRERAALRPPGPDMTVVSGRRIRRYLQGPDRIVFAHGGGFVLGDLDTHDAFCRRLAAATGHTVVAVDYRRAPEHPFPAGVDDVVAVVEHELADGGRVAVAGDSAGGFLAMQAALRFRERLSAQLLTCPLADLALAEPSVAEKGTGYTLEIRDLREWLTWWAPAGAASPLEADLTGLPPALVVTAEHDPLRDGGDRYASRLRRAGVAVRHRTEPGLLHNFSTTTHLSAGSAAADRRFLADAAALTRW